jgi:lysophospholipase L1-like esterase
MTAKKVRGVRVSFVLILALALGIGSGLAHDAAAKKSQWVAAWGFSIQGLSPTLLNNQTVRMIARPTVSGSALRVRIDNTFGTSPLVIGAAAFAVRNNGAQLVPASTRPLTFGGSATVIIPAGGGVYTDALSYEIDAWQDVAVSLWLPGAAVQASRHGNARTTSFLTPAASGNHTNDEASTAFTGTTTEMLFSSTIDVLSTARGAVVFLGDSITDGTATTTDGHDRWHDVLYLRRLLDPGPGPGPGDDPELSFVNEGIGGNRVTVTAGQGSPSAVERLDRDVLARTGIVKVVFFEGTNDLASGLVNADQLIAGMTEIIDRVHAQHLKIVGATIIPRSNATWTPQMTAYRHQVNDWIQRQARFDGVIDFDQVMRDATNPDVMTPRLEFGDHIHPNPFGYLLMGQSINMALIQRD